MKRWFEHMLIEHCAPTLKGMKPANLFRYRPESEEERENLYLEAAGWQKALRPLGVSVRVLKECRRTGSFLIYIYRENWLNNVLKNTEILSFLKKEGYRIGGDCAGYLRQLSVRLCVEQEFPHEIGIFLGYPLLDVVGFIENEGKNYTCSGYWKAYGDPGEAERRFSAYRRCTEVCRQQFAQGAPLVRLITAA